MSAVALTLAGGTFTAGARAAPVISEVAWMGSSSATDEEWVELYNPGPDAVCDLSAWTLVEGTTLHALPAQPLAAGEVLILEVRTTATSLSAPAAVVPGGSVIALNNGGEALAVCAAGATSVADPSCDVANAGAAWFAGSNTSKATMERADLQLAGTEATAWQTSTTVSAVTDGAGVAINGSPGAVPFTVPTDGGLGVEACSAPDAGVPDDGGEAADAGATPFPYAGLAVTEIFFNAPGGSADVGREWIEATNLSGAAIALDGVVVARLVGATAPVVDLTTTIADSGVVLQPGDRVVLAQSTDLGVGACLDAPIVVLDAAVFAWPQSSTYWARLQGAGFTNDVRYVYTTPPPSTFDGKAMALVSEDLDNGPIASFAAATCAYAATSYGTPGAANDTCAPAVCPGVDAGSPAADAGTVDDAGSVDDAGTVDDAGAAPDAGIVQPFAYDGLAVVEVFFNAPGTVEYGREWIELANLGGEELDVDGALLEVLLDGVVERAVVLTAPGLSLLPGERLVIAEREDLGVGACVTGPLLVVPDADDLLLQNGATRSVRISGAGFEDEMTYSGPGLPPSSSVDGISIALVDDALDNDDPASLAASPCAFASGASGSPGATHAACVDGTFEPCLVDGAVDAGVEDAGAGAGDGGAPAADGGGAVDAGLDPDAGFAAADAGMAADAGPVADAGPPSAEDAGSPDDPEDAGDPGGIDLPADAGSDAPPTAAGGCGCGQSSPADAAALLGLLLIPAVRRSRRAARWAR